MPKNIISPYANILPFLSTIPKVYWKYNLVPGGALLVSGNPRVDDEYLFLMKHSPDTGTVSFTGTGDFPQFSEVALGDSYRGQCVAFAKAMTSTGNIPSNMWKPGLNLRDFSLSREAILPSEYQGLMIACFDGKQNYSLADASRKHVAILLEIIRGRDGKPESLLVVDQNYYNYPSYKQYSGRISRHLLPFTSLGKGVGYAHNYHIVTL